LKKAAVVFNQIKFIERKKSFIQYFIEQKRNRKKILVRRHTWRTRIFSNRRPFWRQL